jgi:hypothetical protein
MNDRITLLALKASDPKTGWLDRQKFAELIVRECANMLDEDSYMIPELGGYAHDIRKHFGVEE